MFCIYCYDSGPDCDKCGRGSPITSHWYKFDIKKIKKKFGKHVFFVAEASIEVKTIGNQGGPAIDYIPMSIYYDNNPDRSKGHKNYIMIFKSDGQFFVTGKDLHEFTHGDRFQNVLTCTQCNTKLISVHQHDFNQCPCLNEAFIDGGRHYSRIGAVDMNQIKFTTMDILKVHA